MTEKFDGRFTNHMSAVEKFGYQPIQERGHQPIAARPAVGNTTANTQSSHASPPTQGSSAKK